MQHKDHLSDDVIRIFHNAKGSVKNNVEKWVNHIDAQMSNSEESADIGWNSNSQRDHAAGEYEPIQERNTPTFSTRKEQEDSKKHHSEPTHENDDIDVQIDEENRILLENEERMEDIEDIRSEYRGNIGDKR